MISPDDVARIGLLDPTRMQQEMDRLLQESDKFKYRNSPQKYETCMKDARFWLRATEMRLNYMSRSE